MVQNTFHFTPAPPPTHYRRARSLPCRARTNWPWAAKNSSIKGKLSPCDWGYTIGIFSPNLVFMTLLGPSQRQTKATSKRQMAKEHNLSQTFQTTNSPWQELLGALCIHPVVPTEPCRRTLQSERVDKNHLFNLLWQFLKNKPITNQREISGCWRVVWTFLERP